VLIKMIPHVVFLSLKIHGRLPAVKIVLDGQGQELYLNSYNAMSVMPGTTLIIQNVLLNGVGNLNKNNIKCVGRDALIVFKNTELRMTDNYSFTNGFMSFCSDAIISGDDHIFTYASNKKSMVTGNAQLLIDTGVTFSYDSPGGKKQFGMDPTARIVLDGCSLHSTRSGLHLTQGTLVIDDRVTLSSEALYNAQALEIDSTNVEVRILPGATMDILWKVCCELAARAF
jgi:hypothetical protein